jgi:hypothetical protein
MSISAKEDFAAKLVQLVNELKGRISTDDGQWTVKGFIDIFRNVYTISSDTKIVSKILEIHLFPQILAFAQASGYKIVLAEHQNYYPDISFVKSDDESIKFAVDFKTTYRKPENPKVCNGFTLGSHGKYFKERDSGKNIQFPYSSYSGHFCLGIIYDRTEGATIDKTCVRRVDELKSIVSVVKNFEFFVAEKWRIASDKGGSGNTANIGSIKNIADIMNGHGMFSKLGESWFDDYWMNYNSIKVLDEDNPGKTKTISNLTDFVKYKKGDVSLIVVKRNDDDVEEA